LGVFEVDIDEQESYYVVKSNEQPCGFQVVSC
jgi:hypothetical protein